MTAVHGRTREKRGKGRVKGDGIEDGKEQGKVYGRPREVARKRKSERRESKGK